MRDFIQKIKLNALCAACAALAFCAIFASGAQAAQNNAKVEVGTLSCTVSEGVGFIFGSTKSLSCKFNKVGTSSPEYYTGQITKYGLDIGVTGKAVILWSVLAPTDNVQSAALSGSYSGVAADASLLAGGGAKVLLGGSNKTIVLQPVSIQAQTGVNLALGIASLELKARR